MTRPLLSLGLALFLGSVAPGETLTYPLPTPPPNGNVATLPVPRLDWVQRFHDNLDRSKKMAKIDLIFDGDSITDWWQKGGIEIWNQRYAKLNACDFAIAGDRTEHLLWRLQQGQVDGLHPRMVILLIGVNNLNEASAEQIAEGIKAIVGEYRKRCPEATILLQGVFPRSASAADPARAKIKEINQTISRLGDGRKVIFIDFGDKFLTPDGTLAPEIMADFLHPTPKGYQIWADAIQPEIDKVFPPK